MNKKLLVRQRDSSDCAAACIASVCKYYDHHVPVAKIRQHAGTDSTGTSVAGIIAASEKSGMLSRGVKGPVEMLNGIKLPAIAHVIADKQPHFVVIARVRKLSIVIMDPAVGDFVNMSIAQFTHVWSGILILTEPGEQFICDKNISLPERLWKLAAPQRATILFAILAAILISIMGLLPAIYIQTIIDEVLPGGNKRLLNILSLIMMVALVLHSLLNVTRNILTAKAGKSIIIKLTANYYRHLLELPQHFFDSMRTGEIISRVNDGIKVSNFISDTVTGILLNVLVLFFSLVLMFVYQWKLAIILLLIMPLYVLLFWISDRLNKTWQRRLMSQDALMNAEQVEGFSQIITVKQLAIQKYIFGRLSNRFTTLVNKIYYTVMYNTCIQQLADFITKLFAIIIIWAGCYFVMSNTLSAGELLSFYSIIGYFTVPVMYLLSINKNIRESVIAADRLFEIVDLETEHSGKMNIENNTVENIKCVKLRFGYGNNNEILKDINIDIRRGEIIGVSGKSGCGKSTLAALLQHLYEPSGGQIMVNGVNIKYIDNRSLRQSVVTVSQYTQLFTESIMENITIGSIEPDHSLLFDIAERTGVTEFAEELPDGFNTLVSEQGCNLSGGQKQKIAIARALYRQPSVLILDEATASIDLISEEKMMQTFAWYREKGNTIIIIAHRPSAMKICDRIIYIENGRIRNDM